MKNVNGPDFVMAFSDHLRNKKKGIGMKEKKLLSILFPSSQTNS